VVKGGYWWKTNSGRRSLWWKANTPQAFYVITIASLLPFARRRVKLIESNSEEIYTIVFTITKVKELALKLLS